MAPNEHGTAEAELWVRLAQQQAVARLGQYALSDVSAQELCDEAVDVVLTELDADFASLLELLPDRSAFAVRSNIGWPRELVDGPIPTGPGSQAGYTLISSGPVILRDAATETRFALSAPARALGIVSGISTAIGSNGGTYGILTAHTSSSRDFSEHDLTFLGAVANILASSLRRRRAEAEADASHRVLEAVIESTTDSVFVKDRDGRFVTLNGAAARVLGVSRERLVGRTLHELKPGQTADQMAATDRVILERGTVETFEERLTVDGAERVFLATKGPYRGGDGEVLGTFGIAHDITEREAHEQELRAAMDYADRLIETSNAIVLVLDVHANILVFNRAAEEITGYAREEVLGRNWDMLLPRDRFRDTWAAYGRLVGRDADWPERHENPIVTKAGEERTILWRNSALCEDEVVVGTVSFGIDVTETVQAKDHARQLEERLRQAEKLEALGQLAGGVAHDFNNLLVAIRGFSEFALARLDSDPGQAAMDIGEVLAASDRAAELTMQLLAFGRRQVLNPEVLDLNAVVRETAALLERVIGENVELVTVFDEPGVPVSADRGQLAQVLTNLAVNARDAMPRGGALTIAVSVDTPAGASCPVALLTVTDEGTGIEAAVAARIFEPFFSTKGDDGTGLGLATVYGIVAQSGGEVSLTSEPGRGSTFTVSLPLCFDEPAPGRDLPAPHRVGGTERILLVEDDASVRGIVAAMLRAHGYDILEASTGDEAIACFAGQADEIDLVISDLVMRGLDGHETIRRIRELEPRTKALYMSGYTDNVAIPQGGLGFGSQTGFIQKPFSGDELAAEVRQLLDGVAA